MTHYIPPFTVNGPGGQQALCGEYVSRNLFSTEPTCPDCREVMAEDDRTAASLERLSPITSVPSSEDFDPCAGYRPRESQCFVTAEDFNRHFRGKK